MTLRADVDLDAARARLAAFRLSGGRVEVPPGAPTLEEVHGQAVFVRPPGRRRPRPGVVQGAWTVARLAPDVDLRPGRLEAVARGVVSLSDIRGMAVSAHEVPVHV